MLPRRRSSYRGALPGLVLAVASGIAVAQPALNADAAADRRLAVSMGSTRSDNLGRESVRALRESQTYGTLGIDIGAGRAGQRLEGSLDANLEYRDYRGDRFDDETLGDLVGLLNWHIAPSVFDWYFEQRSGDVRQDPFRDSGPDNRERLSTFTTGPQLNLPVADTFRVEAGASREERSWEDSASLDSQVNAANVALLRSASPRNSIGLVMNSRQIEYDEVGITEYDIESVFLRFDRSLATSVFNASLGSTRLKSESTGDSNPYIDIQWQARIAPRSSLAIGATRRYEDASDQLRGRSQRGIARPGTDSGTGDVPLTGLPFDRVTKSLSYTLDRPRTTYTVTGSWLEERYEGRSDAGREGWQSALRVNYRVTSMLSASFRLYTSRERYQDIERPARQRGLSVSLDHRLNQDWRVALRYEYRDRRDSRQGDEYHENQLSFDLVWSPFN